MKRALILASLLLPVAAAVGAQATDPRLRTIAYVPGTIYTLHVVPGYVATVVLGSDERIQSLAVGNTAGWEVTPSKSADHLFVRPLGGAKTTNVEVVTDSRHYTLILQPSWEGDADATLQLRFTYDDAPPVPPAPAAGPAAGPGALPAPAAAARLVGRYRLSGDRVARPLSVSDDGHATQFDFADAATLPALFAVDEEGRETPVTMRRADGGWAVDRLWSHWVFRLGRARADARRERRR